METLGFPPFQTFDLTTYQDICSAFLNKLMMVMKNRKQAVMKASEYKSRIQKYGKKPRRNQVNWRLEVVKINEAFQHLTSNYLHN